MSGWEFKTRRGTFQILEMPDGRSAVMFESESLGSYNHPQEALDELICGHTHSTSSGIETDKIGLPNDLQEWQRVR